MGKPHPPRIWKPKKHPYIRLAMFTFALYISSLFVLLSALPVMQQTYFLVYHFGQYPFYPDWFILLLTAIIGSVVSALSISNDMDVLSYTHDVENLERSLGIKDLS